MPTRTLLSLPTVVLHNRAAPGLARLWYRDVVDYEHDPPPFGHGRGHGCLDHLSRDAMLTTRFASPARTRSPSTPGNNLKNQGSYTHEIFCFRSISPIDLVRRIS